MLKVYVEEAEYKWIELQSAGNGESASEWCRRILLGGMGHSGAEVVKAQDVPMIPHDPGVEKVEIRIRKPEKPSRPANHKRCSSGTCPWCN